MTYRYSSRVLLEFLLIALVVLVLFSIRTDALASLMSIFERTHAEAPAVAPADSETAQTVSLLRAALHTDPNPAKGGGDVIVEDGALVSDGGAFFESDVVNTRTANGEIAVYTVRPGDTLSQIADMFDVSGSTILWANDLTNADLIQPGDTLVILPITGVQHVVKADETLASIAKKYGAESEDVDDIVLDIMAYNQLASDTDIVEGETIVIPGGVVEAPAPQKTTSATPTRTSAGSTVVATGGGSSGYSNPLPGSVKTQGLHGYNGVDLGGLPLGTPALAAASGDVIVAKSSGWNGGYGNYVVVKHANGTQTLYSHLNSVSVGIGQRVSAGQKLGGVGSTGRSTGIHLHFEVRGARNPF